MRETFFVVNLYKSLGVGVLNLSSESLIGPEIKKKSELLELPDNTYPDSDRGAMEDLTSYPVPKSLN